MVRVALDLMGGDHAPVAVVDGALLAAGDPGLEIALVGPVDVAERLLAERGATGRFRLVGASEVVGMDEDPALAVRRKKDSSVRVAHRQVRDGLADAAVSVGSTGATLAASVLAYGRLAARPALAVVVPSLAGPLVLLDVGATTDTTPEQLLDHALLGAAYAQVQLGLPDPSVGLLNVGAEPGKGDQLRRDAAALLERAPIRYAGNVEGHDVALGGRADVVVVDGFTGNVLLKGIEGATLRAGLRDLPAHAVLLGVDGVTVVGHGAAGPDAVAGCVRAAACAVRDGLVQRLRTALDRRTAVQR